MAWSEWYILPEKNRMEYKGELVRFALYPNPTNMFQVSPVFNRIVYGGQSVNPWTSGSSDVTATYPFLNSIDRMSWAAARLDGSRTTPPYTLSMNRYIHQAEVDGIDHFQQISPDVKHRIGSYGTWPESGIDDWHGFVSYMTAGTALPYAYLFGGVESPGVWVESLGVRVFYQNFGTQFKRFGIVIDGGDPIYIGDPNGYRGGSFMARIQWLSGVRSVDVIVTPSDIWYEGVPSITYQHSSSFVRGGGTYIDVASMGVDAAFPSGSIPTYADWYSYIESTTYAPNSNTRYIAPSQNHGYAESYYEYSGAYVDYDVTIPTYGGTPLCAPVLRYSIYNPEPVQFAIPILYRDNPTANGTDGVPVSVGTENYPVVAKMKKSQTSSPIKLAVRCEEGEETDGATIDPIGDTKDKWSLAPDNNGQPGTWLDWGASLEIEDTITDVNYIFWARAKIDADESFSRDRKVDFEVNGDPFDALRQLSVVSRNIALRQKGGGVVNVYYLGQSEDGSGYDLYAKRGHPSVTI